MSNQVGQGGFIQPPAQGVPRPPLPTQGTGNDPTPGRGWINVSHSVTAQRKIFYTETGPREGKELVVKYTRETTEVRAVSKPQEWQPARSIHWGSGFHMYNRVTHSVYFMQQSPSEVPIPIPSNSEAGQGSSQALGGGRR